MLAALAALVLAIHPPVPPHVAADSSTVRDLPIVELPPRRAGRVLAVFLTGDGGWAPLDRTVAGVLADSGIAVVALNSRSFLWHRRTPDETARAVERLARHYMGAWNRDRLLLVGYSRGADLLPFVATRLPADLRARVDELAMLGLGGRASFLFHIMDLFRYKERRGDLPIVPELERLRGTRMLCIYGARERHSACRDADPALLTREERHGDHHFDGDYEAIGAMIVRAAR